jgi:simple sugar transport system permease protein
MIRIEARDSASSFMKLGIPVLSACVALLLAAIPLMFAGAPVGASYVQMFMGVFC